MSVNGISIEERILIALTQFVERREVREETNEDDDFSFIDSHERRLNKAQNENLSIISTNFNDEAQGYQFSVKTIKEKIYTVLIGKQISCTCADHRYRSVHCKHILFILQNEIRVDLDSPIYLTLLPNKQLLDQVFEYYLPPL